MLERRNIWSKFYFSILPHPFESSAAVRNLVPAGIFLPAKAFLNVCQIFFYNLTKMLCFVNKMSYSSVLFLPVVMFWPKKNLPPSLLSPNSCPIKKKVGHCWNSVSTFFLSIICPALHTFRSTNNILLWSTNVVLKEGRISLKI